MNELFQTIPKLLDEFGNKHELRAAFVFAAWRKTAGASLSKHTVPLRLSGKQLVIGVSDKMWKRHLELLSGQMIYKLNSSLKQEAVSFIEFRIDPDAVEFGRAKLVRKFISDKEFEEMALEKVTPALRKSADSIKDDNLRYQFLLAAGGSLARREKLKQNT